MNKNPKIMVFKLKELIYTGIFLLLGILLILLLVWMFGSEKSKEIPTAATPDTAVNTRTANASDSDNSSGPATDAGIQSSSDTSASADSKSSSDTAGSADPKSSSKAGTNAEPKKNTGDSSVNKTDSEQPTDTSGNNNPAKDTSSNYQAGIYTTSLLLNNSALEIEVRVSSDRITSVSIKNMDTAIQTMYPLIENAMKDIEQQIIRNQSLQQITYTEDCKYTYQILLDGIKQALSKASLSSQ